MNLFFWRKNNQGQDAAYAPYEEIDAKRTSKLGYFFLILMVLFGVLQGQNFLGALTNSVTQPELNSYCLSQLAQYAKVDPTKQGLSDVDRSYYYGTNGYYGNTAPECVFSTREKELTLDSAYAKILPLRTEIATVETSIQTLQQQIYAAEQQKQNTVKEYDVSLQEKMANTQNPVFDQNGLQSAIVSADAYVNGLNTELGAAIARKQTLENSIVKSVAPYKSAIQKALDQYAHDLVVYQFKQFLLSLFFILPLFVFTWRFYNSAKDGRSEYAIIWGGALATVSIMLAEILLVFVYQILPQGILQAIFSFLEAFQILWAVLYWLGFILVPLFFGFLIYLIQKKFYNKRAVMMRALKNEHCPNCSLKINHTMNNCPVCGYRLKVKCTSCGAMSMDGGSFCQECGVGVNGLPGHM